MRSNAIFRIRILTVIIALIAFILASRLYHIQIMHASTYEDEAKSQYVHTASDLFKRGSIFFTSKDGEEVSAATIRGGYLVSINPSKLNDLEAAYAAVNTVVPIDRDDFMRRAGNKSDTYEVVATKVDEESALKIKNTGISGIGIYRDQWRYYPGDTLAAQTIGFMAYDDDRLVGRYGLERYYDDLLRRDGDTVSVNFFAEIFGNLGIFSGAERELRSGDVITSIEPTVSRMLETELAAVQDRLKSKTTGGIIMDPKTGEIYAIASLPTFNVNDRSGIDDIARFRNPLVEDVYELGSIIKPLTMAAGIDAGAVNAGTTYYDAGTLTIEDYTIANYDGKGRGTVSMQEVLNQSLNTGVAFVVKTMGRSKFREYFLDLGLGTETGIDLPNEAHGLVKNLESPRDIEYATASYGQGIGLTPIAAVRALSALANGGVLVTPHVAKKIRLENGVEEEVEYPDGERVFKESTSEEISRMLTIVVDKALRGGTKKLEHYTVAAKTGTAQIAQEGRGGYYDDRYLHSFFGYFPSYDPKFIIFLYTVEPQGVQYASETLTDPFSNLVQFLINYYSIPPDR